MSILITVIIPCFDVEDFIEECLYSVIGQTHKNIEIIVVDNNCTDNTISKVLRFSDQNKVKIRLINQVHQGASFARASGIEISNGTWIQFLDADDLLLPNKIEHQLNLIDKNACVIVGATIELGVNGIEKIEYPSKCTGYGLLKGHRNVGSTCSNLWRRESVLAVGGFDTALIGGEEYDLMCKIFLNGGRFVLDNTPHTLIRARKFGQITQQNIAHLNFYYLKVIERHLQILDFIEECFPSHILKTSLFISILSRLALQSLEFPQESARQYHSVFLPAFESYVSSLPLKEKIKIRLYNMFGYEKVRKTLNKRMQWSQ